MPIFARRRLAAMLRDLNRLLPSRKRRDLLSRLEDKRTTQAMAAEAEISVLWALSRTCRVKVEPKLHGTTSVPEALVVGLLPGRQALVEVTAVSDDTMSGDTVMRRAASILVQEANRIRRGTGRELYFTFLEESGYKKSTFFRRRKITANFAITEQLRSQLAAWVENWPGTRTEPLRLQSPEIDVVISARADVHPHFNFFCTMPALAYSVTDNTLYSTLHAKADQLRARGRFVKCIFVMDAGCAMLRDLRSAFQSMHVVSGEQIIQHFLRNSEVDVVCVFSAGRSNSMLPSTMNPVRWSVAAFTRTAELNSIEPGLRKLASVLPPPVFEAYNARSLHRQGGLDPQARGWWLGMRVISGKGRLTIKLSARALQEVLAGRESPANVVKSGPNAPNLFELALQRGETIKAVRLEQAGLDEDDDHVVFEFGHDVAAADFKDVLNDRPSWSRRLKDWWVKSRAARA